MRSFSSSIGSISGAVTMSERMSIVSRAAQSGVFA